jgi:hypothetical protein
MKTFAQKLNTRLIFPIGILLLLLSGCNQNNLNNLIKKIATPEDEAMATNCVTLLQQNKFDQIEKVLDPSIKTPTTRDTLARMAEMIPVQEPKSIKILGVDKYYAASNSSNYEIDFTFEYQFPSPSRWVLINITTQRKDGNLTIITLNVRPLKDSLENLNKFTLTGKNLFQDTIFAFAVLIPLFTLYALVLCIRTKMKKRKWLWIIFIILGLGQFTVNWTTGQWHFSPLSFTLFGVTAAAPLYMTWFISISLPLGAIVFLIRRKKIIASTESAYPTL